MKGQDERDREIEALRDRVSRLSAAMLSISGTLDLQTVLKEVVRSACALTGARFGAIATIDENGEPEDFFTPGIPADAPRRMVEWPEGPRLFQRRRDLPGPPKARDVGNYVRSLGYSPDLLPHDGFQGTPMHHRGVHVGNFYLAGKEGGEKFTGEDEKILLPFASQAAAAIANARIYRAERRARADLEALLESSPVGVAVFDVRTSRPVSFNREATRIVESLHVPRRRAEELLESIICRRGDGREIALGRIQLASVLCKAEPIRAEEVVLSVPDGRSVPTLVNVTPIRLANGDVESVVVTLQDMTPLQELGRARSEFVSMVSHELRAPLATIKGSTATVLNAPRGFGIAELLQFFRIIDEQADHLTSLTRDLLDVGRIEAGTLTVSPEPCEVDRLVDQARSAFLAAGVTHAMGIDLEPDLPRVMADRERIQQVLNNLFINAARHAPESSPIRVAAVRDETHVAVSVSDEGPGIASERIPLLFDKYAGGSSREGGAGLGLAICRGLVEAHGGRIRAESPGIGHGARFTFTIPVADEAGAPRESAASLPGALRDGYERTRILVVDDDPQMLRFVRGALSDAGYAPLVAVGPADLSRTIGDERPALVLLDLVLPGIDGIELMQSVPELADLPVIFISAYGRDETIARALDAGGEDYVVKPFSATELVARVRAALRRRAESEPHVLGDLAIDYDRQCVTVAGREVQLTATEYDLLHVLARNAGRVSSYEMLLRRVWRVRAGGGDSRLVRAYVKRLRKKIGDVADAPAYIINVRGVGYRMPQLGAPGGS